MFEAYLTFICQISCTALKRDSSATYNEKSFIIYLTIWKNRTTLDSIDIHCMNTKQIFYFWLYHPFKVILIFDVFISAVRHGDVHVVVVELHYPEILLCGIWHVKLHIESMALCENCGREICVA